MSFQLEELIYYLNMTYSSHSKKVTVELLHNLLTGKVNFQVDGIQYHQHLINNLQIPQIQGRGKKTQVYLTLHPLVFYNLLELYKILPKDLVAFYHNVVNQLFIRYRNIYVLDKRISDVADILFMRFYFAFLESKPQLLMEQVKARNKKKQNIVR